jgi:transaldolase
LGVNVNITLLFSVDRYEQVVDAYVSGLEARAEVGEPLDGVNSVASFFLSRIDTKIDQRLPDGSPLRGQVALASARRAYRSYQEKFAGPRWERLARRGARTQRPLWASTGTKNPAYSDVVYVSRLIAADVVNTMPIQTLRAFADHGQVTGSLDDGHEVTGPLEQISATDIDLAAVTAELEREGVQAFCDSFSELLDCVRAKLHRVAAQGSL